MKIFIHVLINIFDKYLNRIIAKQRLFYAAYAKALLLNLGLLSFYWRSAAISKFEVYCCAVQHLYHRVGYTVIHASLARYCI